MDLVRADDLVGDVAVGAAGVDGAAPVEETGGGFQLLCAPRGLRRWVCDLRPDVFVAIEDDDVLGAEFQADDGAVLGAELVEPEVVDAIMAGPKGIGEGIDTYFKKALALGTWPMFPMQGIVGGPGGKFLGRRLARKYLEKTRRVRARRKYRMTTCLERVVMPESSIASYEKYR